jgi:hypothetical protein
LGWGGFVTVFSEISVKNLGRLEIELKTGFLGVWRGGGGVRERRGAGRRFL